MRIIILSLLIILGGCSWLPTKGDIAGAKQVKREFSDKEAQAVIETPCLMTVGAYFRLPPDQRNAIDFETLCQ